MNTKLVDSLVQIILSLSEEERNLLTQKLEIPSHSTETKSLNFQNEPFVGMWQDRDEMADSTAWVRTIRQQHWTDGNATDSH
ncbi:hypothetical protein C7B61_21440 [filamentous cyanobacterium CCP1]|nr:hypothetical protein C7B76_20860 [filamentous cyanobacterium CCP2]PSB55328.1 hypothetical protein C7B61_21440 [filamentous cyanobacterium CCP1]